MRNGIGRGFIIILLFFFLSGNVKGRVSNQNVSFYSDDVWTDG